MEPHRSESAYAGRRALSGGRRATRGCALAGAVGEVLSPYPWAEAVACRRRASVAGRLRDVC
jgi:hypothetical protein